MKARLAIAVLMGLASAADAAPWMRLVTAHFELLTDASEPSARALLLHLEQLRRVFDAQSVVPRGRAAGRVQVVAFRSAAEYAPYRLETSAEAYFLGAGERDWIVMPLGGAADLGAAAHEYTHTVIRRAGLGLPPWLAEGLADVFSTAWVEGDRAVLGDPHRGRLSELRHASWIPLEQLMAYAGRPTDHDRAFYAESWALVHMLWLAPDYRSRFSVLVGSAGQVERVYGTRTAALEAAVRAWIGRREWPVLEVRLTGPTPSAPVVEALPRGRLELALAGLDLALGRTERARTAYLRLETDLPGAPEVQEALGRLALASGGRDEARQRFSRALQLGTRDARLAYDYAMLLRESVPGTPGDPEVSAALQRALELDPAFEEARFALALERSHAGRDREALDEFRAIRQVSENRAFAYYLARAQTELALGLENDALASATQARGHAGTAEERHVADGLAWMARSEVVVQLTPQGAAQLTRIAREPGAVENWNPFVEPADRLERREGELRQVECAGADTRVTVVAEGQAVVLAMPDPSRVAVRGPEGAPAGAAFEFVCGPQNGARVMVEYAAAPVAPVGPGGIAGVLRGLRFLP